MADVPMASGEGAKEIQDTAASNAARARELYKYFQPPPARATADAEPPDTVLTAHAQLVAWRFNAQRAMISLIDRETQYFIAESTKTLHLDDALQHDEPEDAIWAGCISVPKAGRLCEHTIAALPPQDGGPAYFEVLDLSKDDRFNSLSFISGEPHFRYYIGVPIRTRRGINIGSIFALDNKVRHASTRKQRQFLAVMAENVVQHLELMKDKRDKRRSETMNRCLSAFVDPDHQVRKRHHRHSSRAGSEKPSSPKHSRGPSVADSHHTASPYDSDSGLEQRVEGDERLETFTLAANLMCNALDLDEGGGGVIFLDKAAATSAHHSFHKSMPIGDISSTQDSEKEEQQKDLPPTHNRPAEVIAQAHHSPAAQPVGMSGSSPQHFSPLSHVELSSLIRRHPRGRLFTFDSGDQLVSSSSDEQPSSIQSSRSTKSRKTTASKSEIHLFRKCFPTARQLIFLPLWDMTTSRWAACVAYNCSPYRNFSKAPDFLYCVAFGNCIQTEIARMATVYADQQKSDFIGSISHELRSPLHGILASCEFLGETECSSFQQSLVDTADSCARTLLDTINMVLDYSKINAFERNAAKSRRSKRDTLAAARSQGFQAPLNIYSDVDLAAITEEVVEGVATGHVFRDSLAIVDADSDPRSKKQRLSLSSSPPYTQVDIIVDIPMKDWTFWSQAGALRRIVMNLFGNSLKYTKQGYVHVKLETEDVEPSPDSAVCAYVTLTVADTGQGISAEYMRTKLFTPFAQESSLTPGTGLGLSLVKSIVDMLQGRIEIQSTVGVGTKVIVRLPMTKGIPASSRAGSSSTPSSSGSAMERVKDDSVDLVKAQAKNKTITIYTTGTDSGTTDQREAALLMHRSLSTYLQDWYGFAVAPREHHFASDFIIVEERSLRELVTTAPQLLHSSCQTMVLVLSHTTSTHAAKDVFTAHHHFEEIRHPFGPYKLARAIRLCVEKSDSHNLSPHGAPFEPIAESPSRPPVEEVVTAVQNVTLASTNSEEPDISVVQSGSLTAREDSVNAQMAMNYVGSFQPSETSGHSDAQTEFPFSQPKDPRIDGTVSPTADRELHSKTRPAMPPTRRTISATRQELTIHNIVETNATSSRGALTNTPTATSTPAPRSPRMLLVDDNRINLKLLQTFMKKRKYTTVTDAEDGLEAVQAYERLLGKDPPEPPDIILMDISMPIMNGFEATRKIREIEQEYREKLSPMETPPSALIIALTGLASGRDQSEAFTSGFDLYITKPVRFAEISRLLDNWEANGGVAMAEGVPHGAAVASESADASTTAQDSQLSIPTTSIDDLPA